MNTQVANGVLRTLDRLDTKVGHTERKRHYTLPAYRFLRFLYDAGGTIDFHPESEEMRRLGIGDVWWWIGYEMEIGVDGLPIKKPNIGLKWEAGKYNRRAILQSAREVREHLFADNHMILYTVPRIAEQRNTEVITLFGDYLVNSTQTASEIAMKRGTKQARERIRSVINRYEATTGAREQICEVFRKLIDEVSQEALPQAMLGLEYTSPSE